MRKTMKEITLSVLRAHVAYDQATGEFTRLKAIRGKRANAPCAHSRSDKRIALQVAKTRVYAHRAAWALVTGQWPTLEVDHINGNPSDNRFSNLRLVSRAENMQNLRRARADSTSGLIGAMPHQGRWRSDIRVAGKKLFLGTFHTKEEAHAAYVQAKRTLHPSCTI